MKESIRDFGGFGKDTVEIARERSAEPPIQVEPSRRYADTLGSRGVSYARFTRIWGCGARE